MWLRRVASSRPPHPPRRDSVGAGDPAIAATPHLRREWNRVNGLPGRTTRRERRRRARTPHGRRRQAPQVPGILSRLNCQPRFLSPRAPVRTQLGVFLEPRSLPEASVFPRASPGQPSSPSPSAAAIASAAFGLRRPIWASTSSVGAGSPESVTDCGSVNGAWFPKSPDEVESPD